MLKCQQLWHFYIYEHDKFHAQLRQVWKKFYNFGAWYFMLIDLQEMSGITFTETEKDTTNLPSAAVVIGAFRVNICQITSPKHYCMC